MRFHLVDVAIGREWLIAFVGGEGPFFQSYLLYFGVKRGTFQIDILWFHGIRHAILAMFPAVSAPHKFDVHG